ncbi:MAG: TIR domain-containing protein [candidate division Zixibacteria bacterium]|nr:TIR domain-containing protein [candidate division Zixibacteria bacterium]
MDENISKFDVFLCHNSKDKSAVREIANQLKEKGVVPWLDEWELPPGRSWQDELEANIENIKTAAVFVGPDRIGPWQKREINAYLRKFVNRGSPVIPVILSDCKSTPELPVFLQDMTWVDFRKAEPKPLEQLIWGITGQRGFQAKPKQQRDEITKKPVIIKVDRNSYAAGIIKGRKPSGKKQTSRIKAIISARKKLILILATVIAVAITSILLLDTQSQERKLLELLNQIELRLDPFSPPFIKTQTKSVYSATGNPIVVMETDMGNIEIEVFAKENEMIAHFFFSHVNEGFYNGLIFHWVIDDLMILMGDPTRTGDNGPRSHYKPDSTYGIYERSCVGMIREPFGARQLYLYILVKDSPSSPNLDPCFARVVEGMDIVDSISKAKTKYDHPIEDVMIRRVYRKMHFDLK